MNAPTFSTSIEYPAAARRAGLAAVLVCAFGWYAARHGTPSAPPPVAESAAAVAAPSEKHVVVYTAGHDAPSAEKPAPDELGSRLGRLFQMALGQMPFVGDAVPRPADFAAALAGRAEPSTLPSDAAQAARDAKMVGDLMGQLGIPSSGAEAAVITDKLPPALDEATKRALLEEASAGVAGPTINRLIDEAEKAGTLDLPLYGGRSMRQLREHAKKLGAQADAMADQRRKEQLQALGAPSGSEEPAVVVPRLLVLLGRSDAEKAEAAAQLCDVRFAGWPGAEAAIPQLEAMQRSGKPQFEFAELALKRIRFFKAKRDFDARAR